MPIAETSRPMSRNRLVGLTIAALLIALVGIFGFILPAEYHRDPIGLGKMLGTDKLWAPAEKVQSAAAAPGAAAPTNRSFPTPFQDHVVEVPLAAAGDEYRGDELEYKAQMKKGGTYVYSWEVAGIANPEEFYTEFHGHTLQARDKMTVVYYRKATGTHDAGMLTAPFDGVHGWYFQNQSGKPVIVKLRVAGFYELIPDGRPGNEVGLHAKPVG